MNVEAFFSRLRSLPATATAVAGGVTADLPYAGLIEQVDASRRRGFVARRCMYSPRGWTTVRTGSWPTWRRCERVWCTSPCPISSPSRSATTSCSRQGSTRSSARARTQPTLNRPGPCSGSMSSRWSCRRGPRRSPSLRGRPARRKVSAWMAKRCLRWQRYRPGDSGSADPAPPLCTAVDDTAGEHRRRVGALVTRRRRDRPLDRSGGAARVVQLRSGKAGHGGPAPWLPECRAPAPDAARVERMAAGDRHAGPADAAASGRWRGNGRFRGDPRGARCRTAGF